MILVEIRNSGIIRKVIKVGSRGKTPVLFTRLSKLDHGVRLLADWICCSFGRGQGARTRRGSATQGLIVWGGYFLLVVDELASSHFFSYAGFILSISIIILHIDRLGLTYMLVIIYLSIFEFLGMMVWVYSIMVWLRLRFSTSCRRLY